MVARVIVSAATRANPSLHSNVTRCRRLSRPTWPEMVVIETDIFLFAKKYS